MFLLHAPRNAASRRTTAWDTQIGRDGHIETIFDRSLALLNSSRTMRGVRRPADNSRAKVQNVNADSDPNPGTNDQWHSEPRKPGQRGRPAGCSSGVRASPQLAALLALLALLLDILGFAEHVEARGRTLSVDKAVENEVVLPAPSRTSMILMHDCPVSLNCGNVNDVSKIPLFASPAVTGQSRLPTKQIRSTD